MLLFASEADPLPLNYARFAPYLRAFFLFAYDLHTIKKELGMLLDDLGRLSERAGKVDQHFAAAQKDVSDLQTSISKITPRAEKIRDLDFGE